MLKLKNLIEIAQNGFQALPPIRSQPYQTPSPSADTSSPILVISVVGIIITAFLLLGYYVFVIKCWLNCTRINIMRRLSISTSRSYEDPLMGFDAAVENRGIDESVIRAIPIFQFKRVVEMKSGEEERSSYECAVCLNEFQDEEKLRVLPSCSHAFHIDCIDIWLQNNANCPLCRSSISISTTNCRVLPFDQIIAPSCSPQDQSPFRGHSSNNTVSSDLNFVVIEVRGSDDNNNNDGSDLTTRRTRREEWRNPPPRKLEQMRLVNKKARKFHNNVSSMGDEFIDIIRNKEEDDEFSIQPIRRSISMDSSTDQQLYLAVQEIVQQNKQINEGCSSRSVHRRFVSFDATKAQERHFFQSNTRRVGEREKEREKEFFESS